MEINMVFAFVLTTLAGLSTGIGSAVAYFIRTPRYSYLALMLGFSAGVMVYISFTELLGTAIGDIGFATANIAFFVGILFIAVIDMLVPHQYEEEHTAGIRSDMRREAGQQGKSVPSSQLAGSPQSPLMRSGLFMALGIAIHNIPEGIVVSVPIFYATGDRRKAFTYSFLSGVAEPVGAVIGYAILSPFLTPTLLSSSLAFVAGIMVYISLDEILPLAHRYGKEHVVLVGIGAGMLVMALSLFLLR